MEFGLRAKKSSKMAQQVELRDEHGNPVELTDAYGNPVKSYVILKKKHSFSFQAKTHF